MKNILITGKPRVGKTSLLKELVERNKRNFVGLIAEELRDKQGKRIGFASVDLKGKSKVLFAHVNFDSPARVGKYGVDVKALDKIAGQLLTKLAKAQKQNKILSCDLESRSQNALHACRKNIAHSDKRASNHTLES